MSRSSCFVSKYIFDALETGECERKEFRIVFQYKTRHYFKTCILYFCRKYYFKISIRTCFCLFDISLLFLNENLNLKGFVARCNELDKKRKWFCHFDNIYLVSCLDFMLQMEDQLPLDILIMLVEICEQDFIDDVDTEFWNSLAYTLNMYGFDRKKKFFPEFSSACKVTLFEEFSVDKLLLTVEKK